MKEQKTWAGEPQPAQAPTMKEAGNQSALQNNYGLATSN
jgi:hypothetical protein